MINSRRAAVLGGVSDNRKKITPTFTRASVAYDHNFQQVATGTPRIHPDRGVMIERGTTNTKTTDITAYNGASIETVTDSVMGEVIKVTTAGAGYSGVIFSGSATQTRRNIFSAYVKGTLTKSLQLTIYDGGYNDKTGTDAFTGDWQRIDMPKTAGQQNLTFYITNGGAADVQTFYVAYPQIEKWNWPSTYQKPADSARADEYMQIPVDRFNFMEGTIEAKIYVTAQMKNSWPYSDTANESYIWSIGDIPFDNVLALKYQGPDEGWQVENSGQGTFEGVQVYRPQVNQNPAVGTIQTISVRYKSDVVDVILNGDIDNKATSVGYPVIDYPEASKFNIGCWYPNCYEGTECSRYNAQTWIHSISISNIFRTNSDVVERATNGFVLDKNVLFGADFTKGITGYSLI